MSRGESRGLPSDGPPSTSITSPHPGHPAYVTEAMGQIGGVDVLAAVFAERLFRYGQGGATTLGLMLSAFGVGAVLGPIVGNLRNSVKPHSENGPCRTVRVRNALARSLYLKCAA
ncbi:MAG: hypothetical protein HY260_00300 [Chloroflexi bacterium]|nr:hypothetical protein [Chloroflexota bacterium]